MPHLGYFTTTLTRISWHGIQYSHTALRPTACINPLLGIRATEDPSTADTFFPHSHPVVFLAPISPPALQFSRAFCGNSPSVLLLFSLQAKKEKKVQPLRQEATAHTAHTHTHITAHHGFTNTTVASIFNMLDSQHRRAQRCRPGPLHLHARVEEHDLISRLCSM